MDTHDALRRTHPGTARRLDRRTALFLPVAIAMPLVLPACAKSGKGAAREFVESISRATKRMNAAAKVFGEVVQSRLADKTDDAGLTKAFETLRGAIARELEEVDRWKVPETPEALELLALYRANLVHRIELLDEYGPLITESLTRGGASRKERVDATKKAIDDLASKSEKDATALRTAQRRYATSMGIFTTK